MKEFKLLLIFIVIIQLFTNTNLFSQAVTVNGTVSQNYPDLTSAFDAINLGTFGNGNIQVLINQSHNLTASAVLNGGVFASCEIKPTSAVTVSSNLPNVLIILNGADNVTIDGRIGLVNDIKLSLSGFVYLGDIEMKNGASDNVVKYVSCYKGIYISPSITGTGGNNNNSIENSSIASFKSTGGNGIYQNTGLSFIGNTCGGIYLDIGTKDVDFINNNINGQTYIYSIGTINIKKNRFANTSIIPNYANYGFNIVNYEITNNFFCTYPNYVCTCIDPCSVEEYVFYFESDHNPDLTANISFNSMVVNCTVTDLCGGYMDPPLIGSRVIVDVGNVTFKNNIMQTYLNGLPGLNYFVINPAVNYDADYNCYSSGLWVYPHNEPHSVFKNVSFQDIATCNIHLAGSSVGDNDLKGIFIPGILTDIDDRIRYSPYMGADEADIPLPVELTSFTSSVSNNNVLLNWTTASEMNNSGFDLERSEVNGEWSLVNFVKGHGNSNTQQNYSFTDKNLSSGKYKYRLKQIDFNGNFEYFNLSNEVEIGVPDKFSLSQNYPNPFNPTTKINYELRVTNYVSLKVYDVLGNEVGSLVNQKQNAGRYEVEFDGSKLSSGVYFYKIQAGDFTAVKKMSLLK